MVKIWRSRRSFLLTLVLWLSGGVSPAAEPRSQPLPARPYFTRFAASIDRLMAMREAIYESVDRSELSNSEVEQIQFARTFAGLVVRNFAGLDQHRPLGTMWTWSDDEQGEILFLPAKNIDDLLKSFTFEVVPYRAVSETHFIIDRPRHPYHALVRGTDVLLSNSTSAIEALRVNSDQLTRGLRDQYDLAVMIDLRQIPRPAKTRFVNSLRAQIEPLLQEQDHEPAESANLRKAIGKMTLDLVEHIAVETDQLTIGARLDPKSHHLRIDATLEPTKDSPWETSLNRLVSRRGEFSSLVSPDVPAGLAVNLPLGGIVEQLLNERDGKSKPASQLEAAVQIAGEGIGNLSVLFALRGSEVTLLNAAIPQMLIKSEKSGYVASVDESFEIYEGVVFHGVTPHEMPNAVIEWMGRDLGIIVGQDKQSLWLGLGQPDKLLDSLKDAIDQVQTARENGETRGAGPLLKARIQASRLPKALTSDLFIPDIDQETARAAFEKGDDGFNVTLEPYRNGLRLRLEAEAGFVRLLGRNWAKQADELKR